MKSLPVALAYTLFASTIPAGASTLYAQPPWVVTFEQAEDGEPMCSIGLISPLGFGLSVERRRDAVSVNILDMEKDYAAAQQPMWISVGDKTFSWDGTRLGNVAVTIQDADNAEVTGMLKALGTTTTVEIGTSEQPPAQFPSPADNKAKAIFDICTDLL